MESAEREKPSQDERPQTPRAAQACCGQYMSLIPIVATVDTPRFWVCDKCDTMVQFQ